MSNFKLAQFGYIFKRGFCFRLNKNKTGTRQCARAVWSAFNDIHSTQPGALMHYLGSFPVRICNALDIIGLPNLSFDCDL